VPAFKDFDFVVELEWRKGRRGIVEGAKENVLIVGDYAASELEVVP